MDEMNIGKQNGTPYKEQDKIHSGISQKNEMRSGYEEMMKKEQ